MFRISYHGFRFFCSALKEQLQNNEGMCACSSGGSISVEFQIAMCLRMLAVILSI